MNNSQWLCAQASWKRLSMFHSCYRMLMLLALTLLLPLTAFAASAVKYDPIPEVARIWENRSGVEGSGYENYPGPSIAFYEGGWYQLDDLGVWHLFFEGPVLDFNQVDASLTAALQYEVISGTGLIVSGPTPGYFNMSLDGATGNLVTEEGVSFNPRDMEALRSAAGDYVYYNLQTGEWWSQTDYSKPLANPPPAPYTALFVTAGSIPAASEFAVAVNSGIGFDIVKRQYLSQNNRVLGFHRSIADNIRRWDNRSGVPCSGYSEYSGPDILYSDAVWYAIEEEGFIPFAQGRYLDFSNAENSIVEALGHELTAFSPMANEGMPADLNLRLDGETGQLVDAGGQVIDPSRYNSPGNRNNASCYADNTVLITLPTTLALQGLAGPAPFKAKETSVKLLRVVPLRFVENDPFNDRSLPLAINLARINPVTPPPPPPPPPPGGCSLDAALILTTTLPSQSPLGQDINITGAGQLQAGMGPAPGAHALSIAVNNPGDNSNAIINAGNNFSYVSGSSLGLQPEGGTLTYMLRRNADSAEFEITVQFMVDVVFDDMGIIIQSLSGRQCTNGGPV